MRLLILHRLVLLTGLLAVAIAAPAQDLKDTLFAPANAAFEAANAVDAQLLAPRTYDKALKSYQKAEKRFDRQGNLNRVRADLQVATNGFKQCIEAVELARLSLASLIKSRDDAIKADTARFEGELWRRAEAKFRTAAIELERGDIKLARRRGGQAESVYREAELNAIKSNYLNETRQLLAIADRTRVKRYAPKTLEKSRQLLARAETELTENRYDTDLPRSLAQRAKYEAQHAIHLGRVIKEGREKRQTEEDIILDWETPITELAGAADRVARLDSGYQQTTDELVVFIEDLRSEVQRFEQDINDRNIEIAGLKDELTELDARLGGASEERIILERRLQAQARVREQFAQVEKMFTRQEAQVFREGNVIFIRLVGLSFDVGASQIDGRHTMLLQKVERAIEVFPRSDLVVEGHTDSHGGDEANFKLSQDRANSVRTYLIASLRMAPSKVQAVGYGETQPVANNETQAGRAKNRRIDVRIRPDLNLMGQSRNSDPDRIENRYFVKEY